MKCEMCEALNDSTSRFYTIDWSPLARAKHVSLLLERETFFVNYEDLKNLVTS